MNEPSSREAKLGWSGLIDYGLPGMGVNFLFTLALILYMKFATDVLGISPGVMGAIFFASRVWDAVSDPLAGNASDRTRSRLGRRKSWILASSVPLAVAALAMWSPPPSLTGTPLVAWVTIALFSFYTAYTLFEVPHMALGAEITLDASERIRVFGSRQLMKTPELLNEMLICFMVPALLSVPMWVRLGGRFEKRKLWLVALGMSGLGFGALFFVQEGSTTLIFCAAIVAGVASGCGSTVGQALKADVIDVDEHATGERKEGAYFAAWNFVSKFASGLMLGTVGVALGAVGFEANREQSELVQYTMRFLMGGMPLAGFGIAMVIFRHFSLGEEEHARIRAEIDARHRER